MTDRPDTRPLHRGYESLKVTHRRVPAIVAVGRRRTVAVPALIVAINMADRAQPLAERLVDVPEKAGRVQNHDWRAVAAPVQRIQPDAVDGHQAAAGFSVFHVS